MAQWAFYLSCMYQKIITTNLELISGKKIEPKSHKMGENTVKKAKMGNLSTQKNGVFDGRKKFSDIKF